MNFESPQSFSADEIGSEDSSSKLKKWVALSGVAIAATSGEACAPDKGGEKEPKAPALEEKAAVHPETQKSRFRENYELRKKQSNHEAKLIVENIKTLTDAGKLSALDLSTNNFLKYYYQGLNGERNERIFEVGQQMRVLEIAKSKGIEVDLSKGFRMTIQGGTVPTSAEINGTAVTISESDYTTREKEILEWQKKTLQPDKSATGSGEVRVSPDFEGRGDRKSSTPKTDDGNLRGSREVNIDGF